MCLQSLGESTLIEDESMTGAVGTALYVSPEVMSTEQTHYTQVCQCWTVSLWARQRELDRNNHY